MLVLGRKVGETIMIGDDITITVTRIDHHTVRLRFDAPKEVVILRQELYKAISSSSLPKADQ